RLRVASLAPVATERRIDDAGAAEANAALAAAGAVRRPPATPRRRGLLGPGGDEPGGDRARQALDQTASARCDSDRACPAIEILTVHAQLPFPWFALPLRHRAGRRFPGGAAWYRGRLRSSPRRAPTSSEGPAMLPRRARSAPRSCCRCLPW